MKKFIIVAELKLNEEEYKVVESWVGEPTDYISTQVSEHLREKGMIIKVRTTETDYNLYDDVNRAVEVIQKDKAYEELETEITSRECIGGSCED